MGPKRRQKSVPDAMRSAAKRIFSPGEKCCGSERVSGRRIMGGGAYDSAAATIHDWAGGRPEWKFAGDSTAQSATFSIAARHQLPFRFGRPAEGARQYPSGPC